MAIQKWMTGAELKEAIKALPSHLPVYISLDYNGTYWTQRWRRRDALQLASKLSEAPERFGACEHDNQASVEVNDEGLFISVILT